MLNLQLLNINEHIKEIVLKEIFKMQNMSKHFSL